MTSTAVAQLAGNLSAHVLLRSGEGKGLGALTGVTGTSAGASWEATIGFFAPSPQAEAEAEAAAAAAAAGGGGGGEGASFLMMNADSDRPTFLTLDFELLFDPFHGALLEMDLQSGKLVTAIDAAPLLKGFQVTLLAGDAKLYVYSSKHN